MIHRYVSADLFRRETFELTADPLKLLPRSHYYPDLTITQSSLLPRSHYCPELIITR
jgi:hypothetical protein